MFVIPSEASDLQFAAKCRSLASLGISILFLVASLVVDDALGLQLLDKADHVGAYFPRRREDELLLKLPNDLRKRELACAKLQDRSARPFYLDRAFRKKHNRRFRRPTPAASRRQPGNARVGQLSHGQPLRLGCRGSETHPAAASPAGHRRNRARRAAPTECRTYRAAPESRPPAG